MLIKKATKIQIWDVLCKNDVSDYQYKMVRL